MTQTEKINYGIHCVRVKKQQDVKQGFGRQIEQNHKPKDTSIETGTFYLVTVDSVMLHCDRPPGVSHFY